MNVVSLELYPRGKTIPHHPARSQRANYDKSPALLEWRAPPMGALSDCARSAA